MIWNKESAEQKQTRKRAELYDRWCKGCEWQKYFAWFPIEVSPTQMAWLCFVKRRYNYNTRYSGSTSRNIRCYEYKLVSKDE